MDREIIARIKRRDGFIKEMVIPEIKPIISFVDVPPLEAHINFDMEGNSCNHKPIKRDFFPKKQTIIIDYEEQ